MIIAIRESLWLWSPYYFKMPVIRSQGPDMIQNRPKGKKIKTDKNRHIQCHKNRKMLCSYKHGRKGRI